MTDDRPMWYDLVRVGDRPLWYDLDEKPIYDIDQVESLLGSDVRRVARTRISHWVVSTVFLVLDHAHEGPPLIYETMIFGPEPFDMMLWRCSTRDEAVVLHTEVVGFVRGVLRGWRRRKTAKVRDRQRARYYRYLVELPLGGRTRNIYKLTVRVKVPRCVYGYYSMPRRGRTR